MLENLFSLSLIHSGSVISPPVIPIVIVTIISNNNIAPANCIMAELLASLRCLCCQLSASHCSIWAGIHPSIPLSVSRGLGEKLLCISSEIFIAGSLTIHSDASTLSTLIFRFLSGSSVIPHSSPSPPLSIVLIRVQS